MHGDLLADRALSLWDDLTVACLVPLRRAIVVHEPGRPWPASAWPVSQVLHAAVLVGHLLRDTDAADRIRAGLRAYASGPSYRGAPVVGRRYYDDAAWLGLAGAQAWACGLPPVEPWRRMAERMLAFDRTGEVAGGGVRWRERWAALHACATGPAGLLAARVAELRGSGADGTDVVLGFARRCLAFLDGPLALPGRLVADHVYPDGRRDATVWSYNQGVAIGLAALLGPPPRERAESVLRAYPLDRWWREPPAFAAVLGRMLLLLHQHDPDPRWLAPVDAYLDRVFLDGRDERGLVSAGGIGRYSAASTALDTGGVVALAAARALLGTPVPIC